MDPAWASPPGAIIQPQGAPVAKLRDKEATGAIGIQQISLPVSGSANQLMSGGAHQQTRGNTPGDRSTGSVSSRFTAQEAYKDFLARFFGPDLDPDHYVIPSLKRAHLPTWDDFLMLVN